VEDLLTKAGNADILYSDGSYLLDSLDKLKNMFVVYPYVELGVFDSDTLAKNGVIVANAQGGNRDSIVERAMYMTLSLFRNFFPKVRTAEDFPFALDESLQ
jgi:phosphoglycerate dehydrogenase-like enzyme